MGSKPFQSLPITLLGSAARRTLVNRVRSPHAADVVNHRSTAGTWDGLSFIPTPTVERLIPESLARLRESCPLPFVPHVFVFRPGTGIAPHVDGRKDERQCAIIEPLYPINAGAYAPTLFWQDGQVTHTLNRCDQPALVNLQVEHSVPAPAALRINFQLAFPVPYAVALDRLASWRPISEPPETDL